MPTRNLTPCLALLLLLVGAPAVAELAVRGALVHSMEGPPIEDGVVLVVDGKITAVGPSTEVEIPDGWRVLEAAVVTPGLIDAHATVGLTGHLNQPHDQHHLDTSEPLQPELRAIDAYDAREPLLDWIRGFGVTTVHTGHSPGALISGETLIVKTHGDTVAEALLVPRAMISATLGVGGLGEDDAPPGTRPKAVALLRSALLEAQTYRDGLQESDPAKRPDRNLRLESLARVLDGETRLLVTAQRAQDIVTALRIAEEHDLSIVLDGAAEAPLVADEIAAAGVPVILHPLMARHYGELENASFETPLQLLAAGIPFAFQGGYEAYVPKVRVVLFEAAIAAGNGLEPEAALAAVTRDAARILGVEDRIGSLRVGKDADLVLFDGDPFEYTSHVTGVVIDGELVEDTAR